MDYEHESPDSRRARRVEAAFRVRYRSLDDLIVALTHDLSRGGMFMRTPRFLPINSIVRVHLDLPDGGGDVKLLCRVAFVRGPADAAARGKPAGMGVEFLDLDDSRLAQLTQFVAERSRDGWPTGEPRTPLDIILVDDDPMFRDPLAEALRRRGDVVRLCGDGLDALAACMKEPPDVLVTDVQMPRMDGWQLLRLLRARPSLQRVPVALLTTLSDDDARLRGYRLGVDDYIAKPVRQDELLARIDRLVARTRAPAPQPERHSLRGDLEHVSLASLLSFLALEHKTGVLLLVGAAGARLYLRGGALLRVEIDDVAVRGADDPALFALLGWQSGQFEFASQEVACADELDTTVTALLLEQARRSDERAR